MPILVALLLFVSVPAAAQVNCQTVGAMTYCNHGQVAPEGGTGISGDPGESAQRPGDTAGDSDPLRLSDRVIDNQGNAWRDLEGTTYGSDGTICQRLGHFLHCN